MVGAASTAHASFVLLGRKLLQLRSIMVSLQLRPLGKGGFPRRCEVDVRRGNLLRGRHLLHDLHSVVRLPDGAIRQPNLELYADLTFVAESILLRSVGLLRAVLAPLLA